VDERAVAFLRELARVDEDAAATLAELDELAAGVDHVRVRAADLEAFFVRFPADRAAALAASREAELAAAAAHEELVRAEAESSLPLVPKYFEVSFGTERSTRGGLDLGGFSLSGKIDRVDVDPHSARGIVWDYKSGKTVLSAQKIESERRLQIPLYMLVLRDLVGIEPLGGLYRALAGQRDARGLLRAEAKDDGVPGFASRDYLD